MISLQHPLWLCPFRVFFLATASSALLLLAAWGLFLTGFLPLPPFAGGAVIWHAHELLHGCILASVIGFILTAVPEFTGVRPIAARHVRRLFGLWLLARTAFALSGLIGSAATVLAALCDLGLLAGVLLWLAKPLWQGSGRRHLAFFHALLALFVVECGFYASLLGGGDALPWLRLTGSLSMILIIIALSRISMRLVNDVLVERGDDSAPYVARPPRRNLAILTLGLHGAAGFWLPGNPLLGWLALAAAAAVFNLLNDWHIGKALWRRWVLLPYLVYWLMALAYTLQGLSSFFPALPGSSSAAHLAYIGSIGLSMLIVMSIAGRLHAGHDLDRRNWLPWSGAILLLAAGARYAPDWLGAAALLLASGLWCLAWFLYLRHALPVLLGPRPDNRAGCDEGG